MTEANVTANDNKNLYLLVVDSTADDRFIISLMLQRHGYNVCTATSTAEAFSYVHVAPPSVIIAESVIGIDLVFRFRKNKQFSDIPIIVLAKSMDSDLEMRLRKGELTACLTKPVEEEKFFQTVQAALGKARRRNIRIETSLLARLDNAEEGVVSVLSEYGMFFPTEDPRPLNAVVKAELEIGERTVKLEAVVLYSFEVEISPFKEAGMGMKFVKVRPEDQAFIRTYIAEQIK